MEVSCTSHVTMAIPFMLFSLCCALVSVIGDHSEMGASINPLIRYSLTAVRDLFSNKDYSGVIEILNTKEWQHQNANNEDHVVTMDRDHVQHVDPLRVGLARLGYCTKTVSPEYDVTIKLISFLSDKQGFSKDCLALLIHSWESLKRFRFSKNDLFEFAIAMTRTAQGNIVKQHFLVSYEGSVWRALVLQQTDVKLRQYYLKLVSELGHDVIIEFLQAVLLHDAMPFTEVEVPPHPEKFKKSTSIHTLMAHLKIQNKSLYNEIQPIIIRPTRRVGCFSFITCNK